MAAAEVFFDTNVLLYLLSADSAKADTAEALAADGGVISVQVLNEFASVGLRKLAMPLGEVREVLSTIRALCEVMPIDIETHDLALELVERYQLGMYDALIVAAALQANCDVLYTGICSTVRSSAAFPSGTRSWVDVAGWLPAASRTLIQAET